MRGSGALVSCKQATPGFDPGHGWRHCAKTLTFLRGYQASQSGWRMSSLLLPTGCRAELEIEPHSFE